MVDMELDRATSPLRKDLLPPDAGSVVGEESAVSPPRIVSKVENCLTQSQALLEQTISGDLLRCSHLDLTLDNSEWSFKVQSSLWGQQWLLFRPAVQLYFSSFQILFHLLP